MLSLLLWPLQTRTTRPFDPRFATAIAIYLIVSITSATQLHALGFFTIRDFLIILGSLAVFLPSFPVTDRHVILLLLPLSLALFEDFLTQGYATTISFWDSQGFLESTAAFPLAALSLFLLMRRRWGWASIAIILSFLAFKRIAFLGLVAGLAFYYPARAISRRLTPHVALRITGVAAFLFIIALGAIALNLGTITDTAATRLDLAYSADQISMGRYALGNLAWRVMRERTTLQSVLGGGIGSSSALVATWSPAGHLHSDYLKILFEYGWLGLVGFYLLMAAIYGRTLESQCLLIYSGVLMVTDNTMIYVSYLFCVYAAVRASGENGALPRRINARVGTIRHGAAQDSIWLA